VAVAVAQQRAHLVHAARYVVGAEQQVLVAVVVDVGQRRDRIGAGIEERGRREEGTYILDSRMPIG